MQVLTPLNGDLDPRLSMAQGLLALGSYTATHGHSRISMSVVQGYFALGRWVEDVRAVRAVLRPEEVDALEKVPHWSWDSTAKRTRRDHVDNFEIGFLLLRDHVQLAGTALVKDYRSDLGQWVKKRRTDYKRGELSAEQIKRLQSLPGWVWDAQDAKYENAIEHYLRFVSVKGHGRVPAFYRDPSDGYSLGGWVTRQRELNKAGKLRQDRFVRLRALPHWVW